MMLFYVGSFASKRAANPELDPALVLERERARRRFRHEMAVQEATLYALRSSR